MARPMQVQIKVGGVAAAASSLRGVAQQMRQVAKLQQQMQAGGGTVNVYNNYFRQSRGGGAGRQQSTFLSRLAGAVGSTRLNLGPVSPLVGRIGGLVGGQFGSPLTLGLAAAGAALGGFTSNVKAAATAAGAYAAAASTSGGSGASLRALGTLGVSPGQAAEIANRLRSTLESDPRAQLARSRLGLGMVAPGSLGPTDNARILAETLEALRGLNDLPVEQLKRARELGLEGYLEELRVSADVYQARKDLAKQQERLFGNQQYVQNARDLSARMKLIGEQFQVVGAELAKEILPDALTLAKGISQMLKDSLPMVGEVSQRMHDLFQNTFMQAAVKIQALLNGLDPNKTWAAYQAAQKIINSQMAQRALNANTAAVNANTRAQYATQPGMHGGGPRARGALPSQFVPLLQGAAAGSPSEFNRVMNGRTLAFGPWSL